MNRRTPSHIGVTGHRVLVEEQRIRRLVRGVLAALGCGPTTTIVSPLAEGADRLVAGEALGLGAKLIAVLPFPVERYLLDFDEAASQDQFRRMLADAAETVIVPPQPTDDDAYLAAGRAIVERVDVMIALWDGEAARGRGGTADIVGYATASGVPVVWIATNGDPSVAILGDRDTTSTLALVLPVRPEA